MKTVYEEALNDMKKLREVAEANARNTIIDTLAPKLKDLIEKNISENLSHSEEELEETNFATASAVAAHPEMTGATSGGGDTSDSEGDDEEATSEVYEVTAESQRPLDQLSSISGPNLTDRITSEVYKTYDFVNEFITGVRTIEADELDGTIRKIEDIYSYLQEHSVENRPKLEEKLETCYGLLNSFRESKMKMKELVSQDQNATSEQIAEDKDVTLRITGLPDDVELENLNIDIISDEDPMDDEGAPTDDMSAMPPEADPSAPPAGPPGMGEGEEILSDDTVVEVSIPALQKALASIKEANKKKSKGVDKGVLDNFGGGKDCGDPWMDSDMERLGESEEMDEDEECVDELQYRRKRDEKGREQADNHLKPETTQRALFMAQKDLTETKAWFLKHVGTKNEAEARKLVDRAQKRFERVKELADKRLGPSKQVMDEMAAKNRSIQSELTESKAEAETLRKQLAEVNLLNSKLIHANKLLQREGLSKTQKVTVIDKLDDATSLREVKLIYESLVKAFEDDGQGNIREGASRRPKASGSSSRATSSTDRAVVTEGAETARWLELAGLSK